MIRWQCRLTQVPLESWAFVEVNGTPYALFLSLRPDGEHWRGFVLANARNHADLLQVRWSADVMAEHFAQFGESELALAQERLTLILAQRLDVPADAVRPAGRSAKERRLSGPQLYQVARFQQRR